MPLLRAVRHRSRFLVCVGCHRAVSGTLLGRLMRYRPVFCRCGGGGCTGFAAGVVGVAVPPTCGAAAGDAPGDTPAGAVPRGGSCVCVGTGGGMSDGCGGGSTLGFGKVLGSGNFTSGGVNFS